MSIEVLLVYLPTKFGSGKSYGLPPLGIFYMAANLNRRGISARVLDASIKGLSLENTLAQIKALNPKVLGFSVLTAHLESFVTILNHLKTNAWPGFIVAGGAHFNDTRDELFEYADIDYAMYGECDEAFPILVKSLLGGGGVDQVPNLIYRKEGGVAINPALPFLGELDDLPFPNLADGLYRDYAMIYGRRSHAMSIMCSRGCPYLCTFCDVHSIWGRKVRSRSPNNVVNEIQFNINTYGIREFFFRDSTFTLNFKWVNSLMEEIERRGLDFVWHCNARVDRIDETLLNRMKRNGLVCISYGVESGNQAVLDRMKKDVKVEEIVAAFELTDKIGLQANAFLMIGNPGDSPETVADTMDLALRIPATFIDVGPTVAYPGTETYSVAVAENLIADPKWYLKDGFLGRRVKGVISDASRGQLNIPGFSPEAQCKACRQIASSFYFRPIAVWRILFKNFNVWVFWRSLKFLPAFLGFVRAPR
ncbi:hypothetical protein CU669_11055 [Paramagnetospirillum kuznetsovii]|uniref:Uncharacterized protein n=1 Tax=Paramagnetospirillum kuznetsovii TaxID=2053833 RepID=A0A364NY46_9PROT|nr:radical SAM protein [Paramagnetospirillum kuznetsovii]RAU21837.1 hypothetical protein CU669_11055 [Paramagnetospirillum kuznetsovii]